MGLFGKRQQNTGAVRLPADFARTLEQYGRWTFDPPGSGIDPSQIGGGNIEYELFMLAQDDSDAFVRAVAAVAARRFHRLHRATVRDGPPRPV
ncbi:MAG TPA: hypothetical protein VMD79_04025 [Solirubrobacteraceae bacterium]|nr:hypothetical protein [Solirubrobacteraceae bacterium]